MDLKKLTIKEIEERIDRMSERIHTIIEISKDIRNPVATTELLAQNKHYKETLEELRMELKQRISH